MFKLYSIGESYAILHSYMKFLEIPYLVPRPYACARDDETVLSQECSKNECTSYLTCLQITVEVEWLD